MNKFNKRKFEKEEIERFANKLVEVFKNHYGIDITYGNLNFVYHQGVCKSVTLESRNRICNFRESVDKPVIKFAKKVS